MFRSYKIPLSKAIYEMRKYGVNHSELITFFQYAKENPKTVVSKKPVYFPERGPRGGHDERQ